MSSRTLEAKLQLDKLLKNNHLTRENNAVWVTTQMTNNT